MSRLKTFVAPALWTMTAVALAGCMANDRRADIPTGATMAVAGTDHLAYTPATDGMLWVYDVNGDQLVYSGQVMRGAAVVVDPIANVITLDGRTVADKALRHGDQYKIFFQATDASAAPVTTEHHTSSW